MLNVRYADFCARRNVRYARYARSAAPNPKPLPVAPSGRESRTQPFMVSLAFDRLAPQAGHLLKS
jgi:hypothetical protein